MALCASAAPAAVITGDCVVEPAPLAGHYRITTLRRDVIVDARRVTGFRLAEMHGFEPAPEGAFRFEVVRAAGQFACQGVARPGRWEGRFHFVERREFVAAVRGRIWDWYDSGRIFNLFLSDVSVGAAGDIPIPWSIRHPRPAPGGPADRLWVAGVPPSYVRELISAGYALFADDAIRLHAQGVPPDLLREMKRAGYDSLSVSDMLRLQSHGVTSFDVQHVQARGRTNLTVDEIVRLKVNGVE